MVSSHRIRNVGLVLLGLLVVSILVIVLARGCAERRREAVRDRLTPVAARTTGQAASATSQTPAGSSSGGQDGGSSSEDQVPGADESSGSGDGESGDAAPDDAVEGDSGDAPAEGPLAPPQSPPEESSGDIIPVEDSPGFIEIVSQNVTSYRAAPGATRAFQASIRGNATSVTMSISGPGGAFTISLISGPQNDVTNWAIEAAGPTMPGTYDYSTTAVGADGRTVHAEGSQFIVE